VEGESVSGVSVRFRAAAVYLVAGDRVAKIG
jgi:hypothetical protein